MTTIRANCPACGDIQLTASELTVRVCADDDRGSYWFCCPECEQPVTPAEVEACLAEYQAPAAVQGLPSVARPVLAVRSEPDRPQPRLDRDSGRGMTTVVGRVRPDPLFHVKLIVLSHNTVHGAAGGAILNGELLVAQGCLNEHA